MNKTIFNNMLFYLRTLTAEQKQQLHTFISELIDGTKPVCSQASKMTPTCPKCTSSAIKRNGHRAGRQRYKCKTCGKTFGDSYGTPLYRSRLPLFVVEHLVELTLLNRSIAQTAVDAGVNVKTVWLFRQKLMAAIKKRNGNQDFFTSGSIVEADEYFMPLSFKGKRDLGFFLNVLRRMPRHHYSRSDKVAYLKRKGFNPRDYIDILGTTRMRKAGHNQVSILTAVDRTGKTFIEPLCLGSPDGYHVKNKLQGKHAPDIVLVSDGNSVYKNYGSRCNVHLEQVRSKEHARGAFHLAHVNSYHSRLNNFLPPQGRCAAKYLDLYTALFRYSDKTRFWRTPDRVAPLMGLLGSNTGGYNSGTEFANKGFDFDDRGIMAWKAKGATFVGKALQAAEKVRGWVMAFFM